MGPTGRSWTALLTGERDVVVRVAVPGVVGSRLRSRTPADEAGETSEAPHPLDVVAVVVVGPRPRPRPIAAVLTGAPTRTSGRG